MSDFVDDMSGTVTVTSYFGFAIVLLLWISGITWYTSTLPGAKIPNNPQSERRMKTLSDIFSSTLGPSWPVLLIIFAIILVLIAILLFIISSNGINLILSDAHYNSYKWIGITLIGLLILAIIGGTVQAILTDINVNSDDPTNSNDYIQRQHNIEIVKYITFGCAGLAVVGLFAWFIYRHNLRKSQVKKGRTKS